MVASLVFALAVASPKEILLVLNKAEDTVSLIDTGSGEEIKRVATGHGPNEVMVSVKGTTAVISNMGNQRPDKTLTVLTMPEGSVERTIDLGEYQRPHGMAFLDDTKIVLTTHMPEAIHIVDLAAGKIEKSLESPGKGIHMVVLSPDKKTAYAACAGDTKMAAFDLEKWAVKKVVECGPRAEGISLSPDGKTLTVGNVGTDTVTVIDTGSFEVVRTLKGCPAPIRTFWSPDGRNVFVSAAGSREMVVFNPADWSEKKRIKLEELSMDWMGAKEGRMPMNFALSGDQKRLNFVLVGSDAVAELDLGSIEIKRGFKTGKTPDGIAVWSKL